MPVRFNPVVKVKEIEITKEEHTQEIKNPKNVIRVVSDTPDKSDTPNTPRISGNYEPFQESSSSDETRGKLNNRAVQLWLVILILIVIIIISIIGRRTLNKNILYDPHADNGR